MRKEAVLLMLRHDGRESYNVELVIRDNASSFAAQARLAKMHIATKDRINPQNNKKKKQAYNIQYFEEFFGGNFGPFFSHLYTSLALQCQQKRNSDSVNRQLFFVPPLVKAIGCYQY